MTYTVRFAHLARKPALKVGDVVRRGDMIGFMGSTGQSTGAHLHLDCVLGYQTGPYALSDIEAGRPAMAPRQAAHFIDSELFGVEPVITTSFADPNYLKERDKVHSGYDVVPKDRKVSTAHFGIHWNRSMLGTVTAVTYDENSYGHCLYVSFDA